MRRWVSKCRGCKQQRWSSLRVIIGVHGRLGRQRQAAAHHGGAEGLLVGPRRLAGGSLQGLKAIQQHPTCIVDSLDVHCWNETLPPAGAGRLLPPAASRRRPHSTGPAPPRTFCLRSRSIFTFFRASMASSTALCRRRGARFRARHDGMQRRGHDHRLKLTRSTLPSLSCALSDRTTSP